MSRSASAVAAVIKAYDVRGLVGTQLDDAFVTDVGAACTGALGEVRRFEAAAVDHDHAADGPSSALAAGEVERDAVGVERQRGRVGEAVEEDLEQGHAVLPPAELAAVARVGHGASRTTRAEYRSGSGGTTSRSL